MINLFDKTIQLEDVEVVRYDLSSAVNVHEYLKGPLYKRKKYNLKFHPLTKQLIGSVNVIKKPKNKISCLYYDDEHIFEFKEYYFLTLACKPCNESFFKRSKLNVKHVLIDKKNHMLYILDNERELYNCISGKTFGYIYSKRLNSFTNISLTSIKKGRNETYRNPQKKDDFIYDEELEMYHKDNALCLFQVKLIYNQRKDIHKYNKYRSLTSLAENFNPEIPIHKLYKFSSAHETKIRKFKNIIEETCGFKIIY